MAAHLRVRAAALTNQSTGSACLLRHAAYVDLERSALSLLSQVGVLRSPVNQSLQRLHELMLDRARRGMLNWPMHLLSLCLPEVAQHRSLVIRRRFAGRDILQCDSLSHVHLIPLSSRRFGFPGSG